MVETDLNLLWVRGSRYQPQMLGFVEAIGSLLEPSGRLNHVALAYDRGLGSTATVASHGGGRDDTSVGIATLILVMHRLDDGNGPRLLRGGLDTFNDFTW